MLHTRTILYSFIICFFCIYYSGSFPILVKNIFSCVGEIKKIVVEILISIGVYTERDIFLFCLLGVLHRFQHCTGHIMTGTWKGSGMQYIQLVKVLYCKLLTNGKQLPAFPLSLISEVGGESVTTLSPKFKDCLWHGRGW